jgi:hypothetical protein
MDSYCFFVFFLSFLFKYFYKSYFVFDLQQTIPSDRGRDDWKYPYHVPECVSSHLTTCTILGYHALEADFQFARYILQNARLLQVMTIKYNCSESKDQRPQFFKDLPSCPRISLVCKLSFI